MTTANVIAPQDASTGNGSVANGTPLLEAVDLKKHFPVTKGLLISKVTGHIKAVDGVSFELRPGETLGIVGESGCGKSTTAKMMLMLEDPTEGSIRFEGKEIRDSDAETRREYRRSVQAVFQDPWSSLNPRMRVRDLIAEPMVINWDISRGEIQERVMKLLNGRRPQRLSRQPVPSRVLRRAEAAPGHRPRLGPQPQDNHPGRAGIRAGRVHPRPDNEPAQGPPERV